MADLQSEATTTAVHSIFTPNWEGIGLDMCVWQVQMRTTAQALVICRRQSARQPKKRYHPEIDDDMFTTHTVLKRTKLPPVMPLPTPKDIPQDVQELAAHIKTLPCSRIKKNNGELSVIAASTPRRNLADCDQSGGDFPSRNTLKQDPKLAGEVSRKTGCLMQDHRGSKLRRWKGDERLFTTRMWQYLTEERYPAADEPQVLG